MAKGKKGSEEKAEPAAAEATLAEPIVEVIDLDWNVQMTEVQRIEPDPEDDEPDDLFSVTFAVDGPNANASVEIIVADAADIEVVAVALDTLHDALVAWAETIQRRKQQLRDILAEG